MPAKLHAIIPIESFRDDLSHLTSSASWEVRPCDFFPWRVLFAPLSPFRLLICPPSALPVVTSRSLNVLVTVMKTVVLYIRRSALCRRAGALRWRRKWKSSAGIGASPRQSLFSPPRHRRSFQHRPSLRPSDPLLLSSYDSLSLSPHNLSVTLTFFFSLSFLLHSNFSFFFFFFFFVLTVAERRTDNNRRITLRPPLSRFVPQLSTSRQYFQFWKIQIVDTGVRTIGSWN